MGNLVSKKQSQKRSGGSCSLGTCQRSSFPVKSRRPWKGGSWWAQVLITKEWQQQQHFVVQCPLHECSRSCSQILTTFAPVALSASLWQNSGCAWLQTWEETWLLEGPVLTCSAWGTKSFGSHPLYAMSRLSCGYPRITESSYPMTRVSCTSFFLFLFPFYLPTSAASHRQGRKCTSSCDRGGHCVAPHAPIEQGHPNQRQETTSAWHETGDWVLSSLKGRWRAQGNAGFT